MARLTVDNTDSARLAGQSPIMRLSVYLALQSTCDLDQPADAVGG